MTTHQYRSSQINGNNPDAKPEPAKIPSNSTSNESKAETSDTITSKGAVNPSKVKAAIEASNLKSE